MFVANLGRVAPKAAEHGLMLLEALNPHDMPGYFYSRIDEAAGIIARVGALNLRLMFDVYHVGRVGDDAFALLDRYADLIAACRSPPCRATRSPTKKSSTTPRCS